MSDPVEAAWSAYMSDLWGSNNPDVWNTVAYDRHRPLIEAAIRAESAGMLDVDRLAAHHKKWHAGRHEPCRECDDIARLSSSDTGRAESAGTPPSDPDIEARVDAIVERYVHALDALGSESAGTLDVERVRTALHQAHRPYGPGTCGLSAGDFIAEYARLSSSDTER